MVDQLDQLSKGAEKIMHKATLMRAQIASL